MCKHKLLKSMQILSGCKLSACEEELIFSLLVLDLFPCELGKVYYGFRISFHKEVTCLRKDRKNSLAFTLQHCPHSAESISLSTNQCWHLMQNDMECPCCVRVANNPKVPGCVLFCRARRVATESEQRSMVLMLKADQWSQ